MIGDLFPIIILVVSFCSFIQSLFGVGLLVFGTPALLLFGLPFSTTLLLLLPCSIVISFLQVVEGKRKNQTMPPESRSFLVFSLPFVLVGVIFVLMADLSYDIKFWVGLLLLFNAFARMTKRIQLVLAKEGQKHLKGYLMIMGLIHGLTNMGGGLLTILANALYTKKETIRFTIASAYLVFATSQLIPVLFFKWEEFQHHFIIFPVVACAVHGLIGNRTFNFSTELVYQRLMTLFILLFGISLVAFGL